MIEEIKAIIEQEKQIIYDVRRSGENSDKIQRLINFNNQIRDLFYDEHKRVSPQKSEIIKQEPKIENIVLDNKTSFLQSKKLAIGANKIFGSISESMVPKMNKMEMDLQRSNIGILLQTYLSISMLFTFLAFIFSILIFSVLFFLGIVSISYIWVPFVFTIIVFTLFYAYPSSEASTIQKKISNELPFATIHMAAIAGSDMEPTKIFQIIAMSKEYSAIGKELKKVLTQVNIYGYDLLTSLTNVAKTISNKKLSELLLGLATKI